MPNLSTIDSSQLLGCAAKALDSGQRQELAVSALSGQQSVSKLAEQHQVSRKFVYTQSAKANQTLDEAFCHTATDNELRYNRRAASSSLPAPLTHDIGLLASLLTSRTNSPNGYPPESIRVSNTTRVSAAFRHGAGRDRVERSLCPDGGELFGELGIADAESARTESTTFPPACGTSHSHLSQWRTISRRHF